jgi:hypothetical protein
MEKLPRQLLGMFRSKGTPPPLPQGYAEQAGTASTANEAGVNPSTTTEVSTSRSIDALVSDLGTNPSSNGANAPTGAAGANANDGGGAVDDGQRASWFHVREEAGSGVVPAHLEPSAQLAIAEANQRLAARTAAHMNTVIAVVLEQRDQALAQLTVLSQERETERAVAATEHDRFVAYLVQEHTAKQSELERQLKATREAAERQRLMPAPVIPVPVLPVAGAPTHDAQHLGAPGNPGPQVDAAHSREQINDLRRLLEGAYAELDALRALVPRLEEERDAALRDADDTRVQLYGDIETARDEAIALQTQLDDAYRQLEETRDQARDEAHGWSERLSETERELDERRGEVMRLRERMTAMTMEVQHSRPPPPPTADELTRSREEAQQLRKDLIDTKRQLSRVTREFALSKIQRPGARAPQVGNAHPNAGMLGKTPVPAAPGLLAAAARPRMATPVGLGEHPSSNSSPDTHSPEGPDSRSRGD